MITDIPTKLFHVRKTVTQMLKDRNYIMPKEESEFSLDQFKTRFDYNGEYTQENPPKREQLTILARKRDENEKIFVFFPDELKLSVKTIRKYCDRMKDEDAKRAVVVVQGGMTSFAKQALAEMAPKYILESFSETELLVNITDHSLVPRHIVLTKEEKKELLARYNLKEIQLPRIQLGDPVARYYGLQRGQVVKILRPSETAGRYVTYRLVV